MTKRTVLVAVALLVAAVLASATGQGEAAGKATDADRLKAVGFHATGFPVVDKKVTVNAIIQRLANVPVPYDEQTVIKDAQARTNVDIVFNEITGAAMQEKVNLIFASRDYPDVLFTSTGSDKNVWDAAQGGDIWPLNDLIDKYAPNWKKAFVDRPVIKNACSMPDGKVYALPYYREILNDYGIRDIQAINVDWLKKVGRPSIPQTTEEFYQALKAMRKGIDDGVLPKGAVPYYFTYHNWVGGEWEIYSAFGVWIKGQGGSVYLSVNQGKVEFGAIDPKLKDAVKYLNRLYSEKLFPEEVFTDDFNAYLAKRGSAPPVAGSWGSYFLLSNVKPWFEPLPPLAGPDGKRLFRSQPVRLEKNRFAMFKKLQVPEAMIRFIDLWADDDFSVDASYGGPMIQKSADGTKTVVGVGDEWYKHGPHNQFPTYISKAASDKVKWSGDQGVREDYVRRIYLPYVWPQDRHFTYIVYTDKEIEELSVTETEINNTVKSQIAKWIVKGGVDQEWDAYVAQLNKLGLEKAMRVYQTAYDRFAGKK